MIYFKWNVRFVLFPFVYTKKKYGFRMNQYVDPDGMNESIMDCCFEQDHHSTTFQNMALPVQNTNSLFLLGK